MKKLWNQVVLWVTTALSKLFKAYKKYAEVAVKVTQLLKEAVESDTATFVVQLIPGDVDNEILGKLRTILPNILQKLAIARGLVPENASNSEALMAILGYLQPLAKDERAEFYVRLAQELTRAFADGKMDIAEGIVISQMVYKELFEKK